MNTPTRLLLLAALLIGVISIQPARAATATKAGTGTDLTQAASWSGGSGPGFPTSADIAAWTSSSLGAGLTLASPGSWGGVSVSGALTDISITGAGTLTLGASGIDMSLSTVSLSLANPIALNGSQTWTVNTAKGLTSSGGVSGAYNLTVSGITSNYASYLPATPTTVTLFANAYLTNVTGVGGTLGGGSVNGGNGNPPIPATAYYFINKGTNATYQLQAVDSNGTVYTKCVKVQLTQSGANILATILYARYVSGSALGNNFDVTYTDSTISTCLTCAGYGAATTTITVGGRTTLSGANTYSGWTTISGGTLAIGGSGSLNAGTYSGLITNNGVFLYNSSAAQTLSGVISGFGSLVQAGAGTLTLSAANTYVGATYINAGTVKFGNKNALGAFIAGRPVTQVNVASGGAVDFNGVIDATYGYTIAGTGSGTGALVNTGGAIGTGSAQTTNIKLSAPASIGGTGNWALLANGYGATTLDLNGFTLTKTGANTIYLANSTLTTGTVQVASGTLSQTATGANGSAAAFTLDNTAGVTLDLNSLALSAGSLAGGGTTGGNVFLGSATLTVGGLGTSTTYGGVISGTAGSGALVKTGAGTMTLSSASTFTGPATIAQGAINLTGLGALSSGTITLNNANTGTNNTGLTSDRVNVTFTNNLTVANQGTGQTTIGSSGGSGNFQTYSGILTLNKAVTFQAKSTDRTSFDGKITGTGNITIDPAGTAGGRITIGNAANDFVGNVTALASSVLQFNVVGCIPDASDITNNGTIKLNLGTGNNETIGGLNGSGTVQIHEGVAGPQTLTIGGTGHSGTFAGTIINGANNGQPLNLTKTGSGTQTLSGVSTYSGVTTVGQGTLNVIGRLTGATAMTVSDGATLNVLPVVGASTITNAASLTLGASGTTTLILSNFYGGPVAPISVGNVTVNGTVTVNIPAGVLLVGQHPLIKYSGTKSGAGTFVLGTVPHLLGAEILDTGTAIVLNVTNASALFWSGAINGAWDIGSTANWLTGGTNAFYTEGDTTWFDDSASGTGITLNTTVNPAVLIFSNVAKPYSFSGTGAIAGNTSLKKLTSGTVVLGTTNTYTGATLVGNGILEVTNLANGGVASSLGAASSAAGNLVISNSATLRYTGPSTSTDRALTMSTGARLDVANSAATLADTGVIAGDGVLVKTGPGTLALSVANAYAGGTTLSQGRINVRQANALGTAGTITLNDPNTDTNLVGVLLDTATAGSMTFSRPLTIAANGTGTTTVGATAKSGAAGAEQAIFTGNLTLNNHGVALQSGAGDFVRFDGDITGSGAISIANGSLTGDTRGNGGNRVTFATAAKTFVGDVTILSGSATNLTTLQLNSANQIPDASSVAVQTNGLLRLNIDEVINGLSGEGRVRGVSALRTLTVGASNATSAFSGIMENDPWDGGSLAVTKIGTGTLSLSGTLTYTGGTTVTNGTLRLINTTTFGSSGVTANAPGILELTNDSGSWTFSKAITGSGSLNKNGAGTVTLSVGQNYTGPTTVGGGKLYANGALNAASAVSVASNATFGGTSSAGNVTVADGGAVEGGQGGTGALTLGSLTFSGSGGIGVTVAAGNTPLVVTGTLTTGPSLPIIVSINNGAQPAAGTYHILQFGTLAGSGGFALPLSRIYTLQTNGNFLDLVVSATAAYPIWTAATSSEWSHAIFASPKNWKLNTDSSETDFLAADNALFDDTASSGNPSLLGAVTAGMVTFDNTNLAYSVGGAGSLLGGVAKFGPAAVSFTNEGALTLSGGVFVNAGSLTLANPVGNVLTPIQVNGGTLTLANPAANTFSTISLTNGSLVLNQTVPQTLASVVINGNGSVIKLGANTLTIGSTVAATNTGGITVSDGALKLQVASAFASPIRVEAGKSLELNGAGWTLPAATGITLNNSTLLSTVNANDRINILGPITLLSDSTLQCSHSTVYQLRARGGLLGTNVTLTIAGNVTGGGVQFYNSQGGFSGSVIVTNTSISIWGNSEFLFANADLTFRSTSASSLGLYLGNDDQSGTGGNNNIHLKSLSGDTNTTVFSDNRQCTLTVGENDGTGAYYGIMKDGAGTSPKVTFVKTGAGTQTLAGANTYTGTTTVSNGTLLVSGSLAAGSVVTVANTGTLAGTGTVSGPVTVALGGTLRPGLGGGDTSTLKMANPLTLAGTAVFVLNRTNAQNSSRVTGITALTNGGTLTVTNAGPALQANDTFILSTAASRNGAFTVTNLPALDEGLVWASGDNFGTLTVVATNVPPLITQDPQSRTMLAGGFNRLSVTARYGDIVNYSYQWLLNEAPLDGATGRTLLLTNVTAAQAGNYRAAVGNEAGFSTSAVAVVTVIVPNPNLFAGAAAADRPFAYWRLGETNGTIAYDSFGTNDGTYANVTLGQPGALPGDSDKAAGFNPALSSRVTIGTNAGVFNFTGTPFFTLEAWARFDNFTNVMRLFSNRGGGGYGFGMENAGSLRFTAFGVLDVHQAIGTNMVAGQYYHLVAVITNGTVQFYFNGQPVGGANAFGNINTSPQPLSLGRNPSDVAEGVAGLIDEAVVYTNTLTAGQVLAHYQAGLNIPLIIAQQPQSQTVLQWQPATLSVALSQGSAPLSCQWYFSNAAPASAFVPLPGATSTNFIIPITDLTNAGDYYVVITNVAGAVTSMVATLTITADTDGPSIVSVGSLNGWDVGIVFNKPISPASAVPTRFEVFVGGTSFYINTATLRPDGRSVLLGLDQRHENNPNPLSSFLARGNYIYNLDNIYSSDETSANGGVLNSALLNQDISTNLLDPLYAGSAFVGSSDNFIEVLAGGSSLTNASDGMHFVYQSWTNDFVATVRVASLFPTTPGALAGLMARTTLATNSEYLGVFTTPAATNGGAGVYRTLARATASANAVVLNQAAQLPYPNSWLKLRRVGNTFYTSYSSNGTDWVALTSATPSPVPPATLTLGLATTAGTNSATDYAKASYAGFTIAVPVVITDQPDPVTVNEGSPASLAVVATGTVAPLLYQWQRNGADILNATNASLSFTAVAWTDEGSYRVRVSNADGVLLSDAAYLTVTATNLPSITQDPRSRTVYAGGLAQFTVQALGSLRLSYHWLHEESPVLNATNSVLSLSGVGSGDAGNYRAVVSNDAGSVTSAVATLTVLTAPANSYARAVLADAPGAYWRLNEANGPIAYDSFGLNNGGYSNAVTYAVTGALTDDADTAARFDGVSAKADVAYSPALNGTTFTVECWARVTSGANTYRSPVTSRDDLPQRGFIFYAANNNLWEFWSGKGDQTGWHGLSGPAVVLGNWVHLVGTYDGATQTKRFYVNGVLAAEAVVAFAPNTSKPLRIGSGSTDLVTGNFFFPGDVDEVTVYGTALSSNRVAMHYLAGLHEGLVSGQVVLEAFVGSSRAVTFASANLLFTNRTTQTLSFSDGVASYTNLIVPLSADRFSAKTAWNLRLKLTPSFTNNLATLNFTGDSTLPAGDINSSNPTTANQVDLDDYYQLAASWYLPDAASDIDGNGIVDLDDYFLLSNRWNKPGDTE